MLPHPNQMPIGLVLLSRGDISASQLRQALKLQRTTHSGKLGEWLVRMGAASEQQVLAALAVQQRCPIFQARELQAVQKEMHWPISLVERYRALPVFYRETQGNLYVGFLDKVDHSFLYSLEQMLRCRTQPCVVPLSLYRRRLELRDWEGVIETIEIQQRQSSMEMVQTVGNYAQQGQAEGCSLTVCDDRLWIRLSSAQKGSIDFLFRIPAVN
jgi:hypothetical protein